MSPPRFRPKSKPATPRPLTANDAVDIWIARWLRISRSELCRRYGCDPRRLYEIWEQTTFAGSRDKAVAVFAARHPGLMDRIDTGPHRRVSRKAPPEQLAFFD
jgi:hypothetical protein